MLLAMNPDSAFMLLVNKADTTMTLDFIALFLGCGSDVSSWTSPKSRLLQCNIYDDLAPDGIGNFAYMICDAIKPLTSPSITPLSDPPLPF